MDRSWSGRGSASSAAAASKETESIDELFCRYARKSSGMIEADGIELLSSDLNLVQKDFQILMLAWKMQAHQKGYFTLEEWRRGLTALRADTLLKLQSAIHSLWHEVKVPSNFADLHMYAFRYSLTEERQKTIDTVSICDMLDLILGPLYRPQVDAFIDYLKTQRDYWMISMDQWLGFHRFCKEVKFPDLSNYNPNDAWPVILDNFVEWMKSERG